MDHRDPDTYAIIGAAIRVHSELGHGFLEKVYHDAIQMEFGLAGIPFQCEVELPIKYQGIRLPSLYRADLICYDNVIVELKATKALAGHDEAQLINYLRAAGVEKGLLLNFGALKLEYKRMIWSR